MAENNNFKKHVHTGNIVCNNVEDPLWSQFSVSSDSVISYSDPYADMNFRITEIEKQLLLIKPDQYMMDKYPALKEAYDHYQLILKLVRDDNA